MNSPFTINTPQPLIAIKGLRCGYIQLATMQWLTSYSEMPDALLAAAKAWAAILETIGAQRVYWITLSEAVPHLHIHLYPRWAEDNMKGIALFEERENSPQPKWSDAVTAALYHWATAHQVELKDIKY